MSGRGSSSSMAAGGAQQSPVEKTVTISGITGSATNDSFLTNFNSALTKEFNAGATEVKYVSGTRTILSDFTSYYRNYNVVSTALEKNPGYTQKYEFTITKK